MTFCRVMIRQIGAPRIDKNALFMKAAIDQQNRYKRKYITAYDRHHFPAYLVCQQDLAPV